MLALLADLDAWIHQQTGLTPDLQIKLVETAATLVIVWLLRKLLLRIVARREHQPKSLYHWHKSSAYAASALAFVMVGRIWLASFGSLATILGLLSAGIAVALKEPLLNLAGWLFIVWRKPFEIGDRIELGELRGDVVDLGMFHFSMMEIGNWVAADDRTGRLLLAPNAMVFSTPLANYSKGWFEQIWNELLVTVTFESDWRAAKQLLQAIAGKHGAQPSAAAKAQLERESNRYLVLSPAIEPRVFVAMAACGVDLTLRYLCSPLERRSSAEAIWEDVLDAFAEREDIDFAYPTVRYYDNVVEGKAMARAEPAAPAAPVGAARARGPSSTRGAEMVAPAQDRR